MTDPFDACPLREAPEIADCLDREAATRMLARFITAAPDLVAACKAAIAYDEAIRACANEPTKMASFCTAQGDTLDNLYAAWMCKARSAISKMEG